MSDLMRRLAAGAVLIIATGASAQTLTGSNGFYDVAVSGTGQYTARTGPTHPGPVGVNVLYGGAALSPGTTWNSIRSYGSAREFLLTSGTAAPSTGFSCASINTLTAALTQPIVDGGGVTTGARNKWSLNDGLDAFSVTQEVNAEGATYESAVVRVTLCIQNDGATQAQYGMRMMWDWQVSGNDGPFLGIRPPNPPTEPLLSIETAWFDPTYDAYDISDKQNPTVNPPTYRVGGTVNRPLLSPPPTHPSLVQYVGWANAVGRCFDTTLTGATIASESIFLPRDSAVSYFWGDAAPNAITLAPGESFCATQYLFVFTVEPPPLCSVTPVLSGGSSCAGGTVTLDGSASTSSNCAGPLEYRFLDGAGTVLQDWSSDATLDVNQGGAYTLEARCAVDTGCWDSAVALVKMEQPPDPFTIDVRDADPCNPGLLISWTGDWTGPSWGTNNVGTFTIRRSTIDCADAATQPPLATGLTSPSYIDLTATGGVAYTYFVTAEANDPARSCPPGPERGAPFSEACVTAPAIDDLPAPPPEDIGPAALRVRRPASLPLLYWPTAPPLRTGEFDIVMSSLDPRVLSLRATGITTLDFLDDPATGRVIFYKVFRSNACGFVSSD